MDLAKPYFPLETDLRPEEAFLIGEFGFKGYGIFIAILKQINKSYYYKIDLTNFSMIAVLCKQISCNSATLVESILRRALSYGIFDLEKYEKYKILTNESIQLNHFRAVKARKEIKMNMDYVLSSITPELKKMAVYKQFLEKNGTKNDKEKKNKQDKTKLNENDIAVSSSSLIEKFRRAFPDKFIEEGYKVPAYVDMDKLISFINESDFLKHANNLTLKNLCKQKTYEKIIAGVYKDYKQSEVVQTTCNNGRTYTDDEYNALFDSVDEVSI